MYDHLTWEEMQPLMPAVYRAIVEPAPSGEMFADGIRVRGLELLGKYHIQEGLPLCLQLLDIGRWGLKSRAKPCLKVLASYGAAAKSQLPALRKLEAEAAKPKGRGNAFLEDMRQAIATIEAAKDTPPLRSLKDLSKGTPIE